MGFIDSTTLILLIGLGALFIVPAVGVVLWNLFFRIGCKKAIGTVVRIEKGYDKDQGLTSINPIIKFQNYRGEMVEVKPGVGYGLKYMPELHSTVTVYYKTNDSQKAQVANKGLWIVSGNLILGGLFLVAFGVIMNVLAAM